MKVIDKLMSRLGYRPKGQMSVQAVLIKSDGTKVDLGTVAEGKIDFQPESNS